MPLRLLCTRFPFFCVGSQASAVRVWVRAGAAAAAAAAAASADDACAQGGKAAGGEGEGSRVEQGFTLTRGIRGARVAPLEGSGPSEAVGQGVVRPGAAWCGKEGRAVSTTAVPWVSGEGRRSRGRQRRHSRPARWRVVPACQPACVRSPHHSPVTTLLNSPLATPYLPPSASPRLTPNAITLTLTLTREQATTASTRWVSSPSSATHPRRWS